MPVYEYICRKCHHKFAKTQTVRERGEGRVECPQCAGREIERVIEPFFAKTARKSGFY